MRATYCKKKNTYTNEICKPCTCSECSKQGIGSLVNQGVNVISKVDTENKSTSTSVSDDNQSISNITKIDTERTISS
jgi:hypothetical protein